MIKLTRAAVCGPNSLALLLVLFCCLAVEGYEDRWDSHGRSAPADAAAARRLVASTSWGVVSTTSLHLNGTAYGNVFSFSDGVEGKHHGTPFLYMTSLDATAQDIQADARCSLTVSQLGTQTGCMRDPEDPTCAKLTLSGKMFQVPSQREGEAREALFTAHPEMATWPAEHGFVFYYLAVENALLLNHYGGASHISAEDYFSADVSVSKASE